MQPVEIALFVVVAALAVVLIGYALRPHLRARAAAETSPPAARGAGARARSSRSRPRRAGRR